MRMRLSFYGTSNDFMVRQKVLTLLLVSPVIRLYMVFAFSRPCLVRYKEIAI